MRTELNKSSGNPLVTVVVITYNSAAYVIETLESIKAQTYKNLELVIADDFSRDNTVKLCEDWIKENGGIFRRNKIIIPTMNTGTSKNLNRGIMEAKGDWIKIIAGDDTLYPEVIEKYIEYASSHPEALFLHSKVVHFLETFQESNKIDRQDSNEFKINRRNITPVEQFEILLRCCLIGAASVMIKKQVFEQFGFFNEDYPLWEDRPMWLKLTGAGIKLQYLDFNGAKYRERTDSVARLKSNKISNHFMDKNRILYKDYLRYYSFYEKILITSLYLNLSMIRKWKLRDNSFFYNFIYRSFILPLNFLWSRIEKKYY